MTPTLWSPRASTIFRGTTATPTGNMTRISIQSAFFWSTSSIMHVSTMLRKSIKSWEGKKDEPQNHDWKMPVTSRLACYERPRSAKQASKPVLKTLLEQRERIFKSSNQALVLQWTKSIWALISTCPGRPWTGLSIWSFCVSIWHIFRTQWEDQGTMF